MPKTVVVDHEMDGLGVHPKMSLNFGVTPEFRSHFRVFSLFRSFLFLALFL